MAADETIVRRVKLCMGYPSLPIEAGVSAGRTPSVKDVDRSLCDMDARSMSRASVHVARRCRAAFGRAPSARRDRSAVIRSAAETARFETPIDRGRSEALVLRWRRLLPMLDLQHGTNGRAMN